MTTDDRARVDVLRANITRRPHGAGEVIADLLRVIGFVSVVVAAVGWGATDAAVLALALLGLVLPRFLGASTVLDIGLGVILLVAAWSSVIDVYRAVWGWDLLVHFLAAGLIAAMTYLLLSFFHLVQDPDDAHSRLATVLILSTSFGLAVSAIWEMLEWVGHTYIDERIFVGYDDSIGDMVLGGLGAMVTGIVLNHVQLSRPYEPEANPRGRPIRSD